MINLNTGVILSMYIMSAAGFTSCEGRSQTAVSTAKQFDNSKVDSEQQLAKHIFKIFEDREGHLWFGTHDKGVAKYDGESLVYISEEEGLCGKTVADIAQEKDGTLWFGTHSDMCLYNASEQANEGNITFNSFDKDGDVPHLGYGWKSVKTDPEGTIWVNTHHGIFKYDSGIFTEFKVPTSAEEKPSFCSTPGGVSFDLTDSKGNMWFGTDGDGAYKFDGTIFSHFTKSDGLSSNSVMGIAEDKNGQIWFACRENINSEDNDGGLTMYDGHTFHHFKKEKGLTKNNLNTIYTDPSGNIWIGATGVGVYRHDGNGFILYPEPKEVDLTDTFNINGLQSILADSKGTIWMGFSGGLFRLDDGILINVTQDGPWE